MFLPEFKKFYGHLLVPESFSQPVSSSSTFSTSLQNTMSNTKKSQGVDFARDNFECEQLSEDVQIENLNDERIHFGPGEGKGKSMTRDLPRRNLEGQGDEGTMEGVDSVVESKGTVDMEGGKDRFGRDVEIEGGGCCRDGGY